MKLDWSEEKRKSNLSKHGLDFKDAVYVLLGTTVSFQDERCHYGEERWIVYGMLADVFVNVVYTVRKDKIRIISMRKANSRERRKYEQKVK